MKEHQIYKNLLASTKYLPVSELKSGGVYRLICRNAYHGIWLPQELGFLISRSKYGNIYPFIEYHWDTNGVHGTAKPFELIEMSPFEVPDLKRDYAEFHNYMRDFDNKEELELLSKYQ